MLGRLAVQLPVAVVRHAHRKGDVSREERALFSLSLSYNSHSLLVVLLSILYVVKWTSERRICSMVDTW